MNIYECNMKKKLEKWNEKICILKFIRFIFRYIIYDKVWNYNKSYKWYIFVSYFVLGYCKFC